MDMIFALLVQGPSSDEAGKNRSIIADGFIVCLNE